MFWINGRFLKPQPQLEHSSFKICSTQCLRNVNSNVQIKAAFELKGSAFFAMFSRWYYSSLFLPLRSAVRSFYFAIKIGL